MWVGVGIVLDTEVLLHLFSVPGGDWSLILHRIYLKRFSHRIFKTS